MLGAAGDANGEGVFGVGANFAEAFFFGLQTFVGAIERDAELVGPGGERVLDMGRLGRGAGVEAGGGQATPGRAGGAGTAAPPRGGAGCRGGRRGWSGTAGRAGHRAR